MKVISFSLWGTGSQYLIGALKNADIAKEVYPDFECWFYIHKPTVPENIINELKAKSNVKIIIKDGDLNTSKPMMWRFEAITNPKVEVMMSRDTDTRILEREVLAVREWLESDKKFHIMRDHPHHSNNIMGGMFGVKSDVDIDWVTILKNFTQYGHRDYDQHFLANIVYPKIVNTSMIHATFCGRESHAKPFPIPFDNEFKFVGEYVYADDSRSLSHIQILRQNLGK